MKNYFLCVTSVKQNLILLLHSVFCISFVCEWQIKNQARWNVAHHLGAIIFSQRRSICSPSFNGSQCTYSCCLFQMSGVFSLRNNSSFISLVQQLLKTYKCVLVKTALSISSHVQCQDVIQRVAIQNPKLRVLIVFRTHQEILLEIR